jgi:hypothetical protein
MQIIICTVRCESEKVPVLVKPAAALPVRESEKIENHWPRPQGTLFTHNVYAIHS